MDAKKPGGSGCEVVHTGLFVEEGIKIQETHDPVWTQKNPGVPGVK
jgi:hypothetical protein